MRDFNPLVWFGERELSHVPPHFVKTSSPLTDEALVWIQTSLSGRYAYSSHSNIENFIFESHRYVYFENPAEATMYELRWSGHSENNLLY